MKAKLLKDNPFSARITLGVTIEAMKNAPKIIKPTIGFLNRGYKINGESQKSCMSTAKYHKCPMHICTKSI